MSTIANTTGTSKRSSQRSSERLWQLGWIGERPVLQMGKRILYLDEVCNYSVERISERDNEGLILNFVLFGLLACAFVIPVMQNVMAMKFLIAAGLLGAIALMSLSEVLLADKVEHYRLDFEMRDGRVESFVSAYYDDVYAIEQTLPRLALL